MTLFAPGALIFHVLLVVPSSHMWHAQYLRIIYMVKQLFPAFSYVKKKKKQAIYIVLI